MQNKFESEYLSVTNKYMLSTLQHTVKVYYIHDNIDSVNLDFKKVILPMYQDCY